jgi:hypothetical protein
MNGIYMIYVGKIRESYKTFVENPEWKSPPGRSSYVWKDNIKTDLEELGCKSLKWIQVAEVGFNTDCF